MLVAADFALEKVHGRGGPQTVYSRQPEKERRGGNRKK
jgi:hypothetical protein